MILSNGLDKVGLKSYSLPMSNEQQARKDAMADAETLMTVTVSAVGRNRYQEPHRLGGWAIYHTIKGTPETAAAMTVDAARAAFLAVPALRGGK